MDLNCCPADFSLLPAHIITQVLQYLRLNDFKKATVVCKSWHYASTDPKIARTLILRPRENDFAEICKSNRKYGLLKLQFLAFDKVDCHYFQLFEKFCPFVNELHIHQSDIKIHHLLKLLELSTSLEVFSFSECNQLSQLPGLFPLDYDYEAKNRILKNLIGIKNVAIEYFNNIPLIDDLLRCTTNLESFSHEFIEFDGHNGNLYDQYFTIFDNTSILNNLKHLILEFSLTGYADDFITSFVKIKNLDLRSFRIGLWWNWEGGVYKSRLFHQLILKLIKLEEFTIDGLRQDQLSLICQYLVNLKKLVCRLRDSDQPISVLANLKQLQKLRVHCWEETVISFAEIDKFFKCKFEHLLVFHFEEIVTESNLVQFCENHPNLIELKLNRLLTRNLETIFQHLIKLRIVSIYFDIAQSEDPVREYKYKISRLQNLEEFHLGELVNGISGDDLRKLKKLRSTNLSKLFGKQLDKVLV